MSNTSVASSYISSSSSLTTLSPPGALPPNNTASLSITSFNSPFTSALNDSYTSSATHISLSLGSILSKYTSSSLAITIRLPMYPARKWHASADSNAAFFFHACTTQLTKLADSHVELIVSTEPYLSAPLIDDATTPCTIEFQLCSRHSFSSSSGTFSSTSLRSVRSLPRFKNATKNSTSRSLVDPSSSTLPDVLITSAFVLVRTSSSSRL
mmetsp:Transcript_15479/g.33371  ORF Transcript_15479/g.33371 Transcript_15479/m.33371 type:complete len:211 (-) Transcript_15479:1765-2397(-)